MSKTYRTKSGIVLKTEIEGRCPFCGGTWSASSRPPAVVHSVPMCKEFKQKEPANFLKAVREAVS